MTSLHNQQADPYDLAWMNAGKDSRATSSDPVSLADPPAPGRSLWQTLPGRHFVFQADRPPQLAEVDLNDVDPSLRTLLFTDGTVTRTLEAQTLSPVSVEVLSQDRTPSSASVAQNLATPRGFEVVRRRVRIGIGHSDEPVIWAESHIVADRLPGEFLDVLGDAPDGIGESLQLVQLESWREMLWFGFDRTPHWNGANTATEETAITRLYRVIAGGKPALLISETFAVKRKAEKYYLRSDAQTDPNSSSMS